MEMMRTIMKVELVEFKNGLTCEGMRERERNFSVSIFDMGISYFHLTPWFPSWWKKKCPKRPRKLTGSILNLGTILETCQTPYELPAGGSYSSQIRLHYSSLNDTFLGSWVFRVPYVKGKYNEKINIEQKMRAVVSNQSVVS